jgi:hypothetical protein
MSPGKRAWAIAQGLARRLLTLVRFSPSLHLSTPSSGFVVNRQIGERKRTSEDREASYRALVRDVIIGGVTVILLSLAVPAWIIRVEYSKMYGPPAEPEPVPVAEVLRERTVPAVMTSGFSKLLELAKEIVRREAERREAEGRATQRRKTEQREVATEGSALVRPPTQQFDFRGSPQAP